MEAKEAGDLPKELEDLMTRIKDMPLDVLIEHLRVFALGAGVRLETPRDTGSQDSKENSEPSCNRTQ